ncbi:MAG TPA: hypothetical protein VHR72_08320 [Gemmataceae bacterium]|nr:hypothetical protein [Gemmataceae bacterium]
MRRAFLLFLLLCPRLAFADEPASAEPIVVGPFGTFGGTIGLPLPTVLARQSQSNPSGNEGPIEAGRIYLDGETDMLGQQFPLERDKAPEGGVLVGLEIGIETARDGHRSIAAMSPIYRTAKGESRGPKFGNRFKESVVVKAKEGYAVCGILGRCTARLEGFCLVYGKTNSDRVLNMSEIYQSEWIGNHLGVARLIGGSGVPVQGVLARLDRSRKVTGLGLQLRPYRVNEKTPYPAEGPPPREPPVADVNFPSPAVLAKEEKANPSRSLNHFNVTRIQNNGETAVVGSEDPIAKELPSDERLLIGFEVGTRRDDAVVLSATPIYMTVNGEERGKTHGNVVERKWIAKAKDGYAVGGMVVRFGGAIDGFYLIYMKLKPDSTLDANDTYQSEWIGNYGGGPPTLLGGTGEPAVGFLAAGRPGDRMSGLGLVLRKE